MKAPIDHFPNDNTTAQSWRASVPPGEKARNTKTMKTLRTTILLALWGAVSPSLLQAQITESFTFTTNRLVPDGNAAGLSDVRNANSAIGTITSLEVRLKLAGEYNGDLYGYVRHTSGFAVLLNRPGKTVLTESGYPDSGFDVTFQAGAANGDIHVYRDVLTPPDGSPLSGAWEPDGRTADPAEVTEASARTTSLASFNGLNAAGEWTLYLADLESGGTNMLAEWGVDITGVAYPTLAWANPADIVYGTALSGAQLNATATYNSTNVPGVFTYTPEAGTVLNAGSGQTLTVTFTPTDPASFLPVTTNVTINVLNASLIVAADDASRTYGAANPAFSGTVTGQQNGDNITATFTTAADVNSAVGDYAITPVLNDPDNRLGNYTVTTHAGTLSVTRAALTVTADNQSRLYGAANPVLTASYSGFVNGQDGSVLSGTPALSTTANTDSVVGVYEITAAAGSLSAANYSFTFVNGTLTVGKAVVMVQADDKSRIYGAANPALTASYSGFVNGQDGSVLSGSPALSTTAGADSPVGNYNIEVSLGSLSAINYDFAFTNGTLTVGKALLTVAANDASRAYGAANPTLTASYTGFVDGESQSVLTGSPALSTSAGADSPVGDYDIEVGLGSLGATNYAFAFTNGTLTVTPVVITVTAENKSKAYGAALPAFTAAYSGFVLGQTTTDLTSLPTLSTPATAASDAGTYPITAAGAVSPNYTFNYVDGTLTITQSLTAGLLNSSANPALPGSNVTFTAVLSAVAPGAGIPDGTVSFRVDGSIAGSATLSGGTAAFTANNLTHGSHTVVAEYAGSQNFAGTTNGLTQSQIINTPPVAGDDAIERYPTQGVKVQLATLLANDSDADGDTLNVTVEPTSAGGGTIIVSNGWVFYTPAAGYTNADAFTYSIADGHGGSAIGTVTVAIKVDDDPAQNLTITSLGNGSFRISGNGIPGRTYRLQFTTLPSPSNWQDIPGASVMADSTGKFEYTDTPGAGTGFYRSVYP
jgi:hypothetical protein